jgi:ribonucleoside-diphosphate reductase alpha chain
LHNYCTKDEEFDFDELFRVSCIALRNLDNVIDRSWYPTKETHRSNIRHRPVGLGVQGLADVFIKLRMPFDSEEARKLNRDIFETIYYGCLHSSMTLAKERHEIVASLKLSGFIPEISSGVITNHGIPGFIITSEEYLRDGFYGSYTSYVGSPMHSGKFQYHLWDACPSDRWDWSYLCAEIAKYGVRNSLTTAVMPTASTAIMQQCTECIEPIKSNIYTRRTLNGEYVIYNTYLQLDLKERGLWTDHIKKKIIECRGSIQTITEIPQDLRDLYKTAFEIKQKVIIDMAADRGPFVDQTQSMNLFFAAPTNSLLTNCFIYGWKAGLKTGIYYLRRQAAVNALQFTVNSTVQDTECSTCSA